METEAGPRSSEQIFEPVAVLRAALDERCRRNPNYSIRAFARSSGISITVLSLVLSGKRPFSKKARQKLAEFLNLDPVQTEKLVGYNRIGAATDYNNISLDAFSVISDWHHYAILSALELPRSVFEPRWMANHLGISLLEAKRAIERLTDLELVSQNSRGRWRQSGHPIKIDNQQSTSATKKFHKQLLVKAAESIDKNPVSERDFSAVTFVMDARSVEYARKKIQAFRRELMRELECKGKPDQVYQLTMQLFPLSTNSKQESE